MLTSFFFLLLPQLSFGARFCNKAERFCIVSTRNDQNNNETCFTIHSAQAGWAAMGVGTSGMEGSDMYIGWKNGASDFSVFNFKGVANHGIPEPVDSSNVASVSAPNGKQLHNRILIS